MGKLSSLRSMIAFLTIIPVGDDSRDLNEFGKVWFLSPIVGAFIGVLAGAAAWVFSITLPNLVVGPLAVGFVALITGAHHIDGLLDFGDALMVHGSPEKKVEVMHDKALGAGGFALGFFVTILTIMSVIPLIPRLVVQALIVSETSAKLSMVTVSRFGKSTHEGTGSIVVKAMHERGGNARMLVASGMSLAIGGLLLSEAGVVAMLSSMVCAIVITTIAESQFDGVTGDVFGATNEISRMVSLLTLLLVIF